MPLKNDIASTARGFAFAGLSFSCSRTGMAVAGGRMRRSSRRRAFTAWMATGSSLPPRTRGTASSFYSTECPISNSYSPTLTTWSRLPRRKGQVDGRLRRSRPERRRGQDPRP